MPRYKYAGLDLGQVLSRHGDDLATQTDIGWLSFDAKKVIRVKLAGPGQGGFLHPHKSVTLFGAQLFDSKSDAEDDALAKLLHNTAHTGQLSTLPPERRAAVETRYDEIQKWTENEKPKKKTAPKGPWSAYMSEVLRANGGIMPKGSGERFREKMAKDDADAKELQEKGERGKAAAYAGSDRPFGPTKRQVEAGKRESLRELKLQLLQKEAGGQGGQSAIAAAASSSQP